MMPQTTDNQELTAAIARAELAERRLAAIRLHLLKRHGCDYGEPDYDSFHQETLGPPQADPAVAEAEREKHAHKLYAAERALAETQHSVGELLQAVNARTSERDQAREAIQSQATFYQEALKEAIKDREYNAGLLAETQQEATQRWAERNAAQAELAESRVLGDALKASLAETQQQLEKARYEFSESLAAREDERMMLKELRAQLTTKDAQITRLTATLECKPNPVLSRVCELGTHCCGIYHARELKAAALAEAAPVAQEHRCYDGEMVKYPASQCAHCQEQANG